MVLFDNTVYGLPFHISICTLLSCEYMAYTVKYCLHIAWKTYYLKTVIPLEDTTNSLSLQHDILPLSKHMTLIHKYFVEITNISIKFLCKYVYNICWHFYSTIQKWKLKCKNFTSKLFTTFMTMNLRKTTKNNYVIFI